MVLLSAVTLNKQDIKYSRSPRSCWPMPQEENESYNAF